MEKKRLIDADKMIADIQRYNDMEDTKPSWTTKQVVELIKECPYTVEYFDGLLSLEELREINGEKPVWIDIKESIFGERYNKSEYGLVTFDSHNNPWISWIGKFDSDVPEVFEKDYGKTWFSYLNKLE